MPSEVFTVWCLLVFILLSRLVLFTYLKLWRCHHDFFRTARILFFDTLKSMLTRAASMERCAPCNLCSLRLSELHEIVSSCVLLLIIFQHGKSSFKIWNTLGALVFVVLNATLGTQWGYTTSVHLVFPALLYVIKLLEEWFTHLSRPFNTQFGNH